MSETKIENLIYYAIDLRSELVEWNKYKIFNAVIQIVNVKNEKILK